MPVQIVPRVADISHYNRVTDLAAAKAFGIRGIIHKASQGLTYRDEEYARRRVMAADAGLLWGAYHFNTGHDVAEQVENFLEAADPDDNTLLCLDFEDNPNSNMSIRQAAQFIELVEQQAGRQVVLYSGNRLKTQIVKADAATVAVIARCRFWLCQYGPTPKLRDDGGRPLPFGEAPWLWQYTGDGKGPAPHSVPGIDIPGHPGIDVNHFFGADDELDAQWSGVA